mmetsp:Transcript_14654/g.29711  ORF Transcript_14654/g.29711 Transcript_14654/m.29711 type:complete len:213 (+) Transcript_14654:165-803(+)
MFQTTSTTKSTICNNCLRSRFTHSSIKHIFTQHQTRPSPFHPHRHPPRTIRPRTPPTPRRRPALPFHRSLRRPPHRTRRLRPLLHLLLPLPPTRRLREHRTSLPRNSPIQRKGRGGQGPTTGHPRRNRPRSPRFASPDAHSDETPKLHQSPSNHAGRYRYCVVAGRRMGKRIRRRNGLSTRGDEYHAVRGGDAEEGIGCGVCSERGGGAGEG